MGTRNLSDADPRLAAAVQQIMDEFKASEGEHWALKVICVQRSAIEQDALYLQGRGVALNAVNAARRVAGLGPITEAENRRQVTRTRFSKHARRPAEAVDLVVTFDPDGTGPLPAQIDWNDPRYDKLGVLAAKHGLAWGGAWGEFGDRGHVELREVTRQKPIPAEKAGEEPTSG